ncbi:MAG: hypothetical protein NTW86_13720, partial [Candidatus Sumerlaeota bacterium]|nr:hypothetical protein [Candidatus Sumerlaeota bacterium]
MRVRHSSYGCFAAALWAAAALTAFGGETPLVVESRDQAMVGLPMVAAADAADGSAAQFEEGHQAKDISAPRALPAGACRAVARMRPAAPGGVSQIRLLLSGGGERMAALSQAVFVGVGVVGQSNGKTPLNLRLEFVEGGPVLIDRVEFEPAPDLLSLPGLKTVPTPNRIGVFATASETARAEAEAARKHLADKGALLGAAVLDADS